MGERLMSFCVRLVVARFVAVFAGAAFQPSLDRSCARAVGTPVFFSGATNLPRAVFTRSAAATMSTGCGPAWLTPPLPLEEI